MKRLLTLIFFVFASVSTTWAKDSAEKKPIVFDSMPEVYQTNIAELIAAINRRDSSEVDSLVSWNKIIKNAFDKAGIDEEMRGPIRKGAMASLEGFAEKMFAQMPVDGYAHLVAVYRESIGYSALVRIDYGDSGWNFSRFYFQKKNKKSLEVVDIFAYATGQKMSRSMAEMLLLTLPQQSNVARFLPILSEMNKRETARLYEFLDLKRKNKVIAATQAYHKLSDKLKRERLLIVNAMQTTLASGDSAGYRRLLEDLHTHHGDDPKLAFMLLDHFFLKEDYDEVIRMVDLLIADIGVKDPALICLKANAYALMGDCKQAVKYAQSAREDEPTLEAIYWSLVTAYSKCSEFDKMIEFLELLATKFHYQFEKQNFEGDLTYKAFIESEAFKAWDID